MTVNQIPLGEVATFIRGITFKPEDKIDSDAPDAVVCMRTKNVQDLLDQDDLIAIPPSFVNRQEQYIVEGDILVSTANSWELVGKSCWVPEIGYKATAGGFISILRANREKVFPRYLYHWMNSSKTLRNLRYCGRQTTNISNMSFELACALKLPLPPLPEQKRIVAILDKADSIRRKRQEAVRLTEKLLRSVFLDIFGDPVTNPKGWVEAALTDVAEIVSGVTKGRNFDGKQTVLAPYLRVANVQDGYLNLNEIKEIEVLPTDIAKYRLLDGDILLTEGGDPDKLGRGTVWREHVEDCIHQNHIFRVRIKIDNLLPDFLSVLIGSERGKRYFLRAAKQTTGIASINSTQLKSFPVLIPPMELQHQFAKCIVSSQKIKRRFIETENATNSLFNSLLQQAFK